MSLISNIQTGGGIAVLPNKTIVSVPTIAAPTTELTPSPLFPPVLASPNGEAIMMETAVPPQDDPATARLRQSDVEVDNIPTTGDEAVLIDDIDTPGSAFQPDIKPKGWESLPLPAKNALQRQADPASDDDQTHARALTEAAKRAYLEERQIADLAAPSDKPLAELQGNPAKSEPAALEDPPTPQP